MYDSLIMYRNFKFLTDSLLQRQAVGDHFIYFIFFTQFFIVWNQAKRKNLTLVNSITQGTEETLKTAEAQMMIMS